MSARSQLNRVLRLILGLGIITLALLSIQAVWQNHRFWSDCRMLPQGTVHQSWYQGLHLNFGYPQDWQAGNCQPDSSQELVQLASRTGLLWWDGQPLSASTLVVTTEDRGQQTLAKSLAEARKQTFDGQRSYDTTRVDGQDGLIIVDRPSHSANQTTTVIIDKGDRRYRFVWTIQAWTDQQRQWLEASTVDSDLTHLESILESTRLL